MNSRGDPGDGYFRVPLENQAQREIQFMGSWLPVPPMNPLKGRSSLVVDERAIHQELNRVPSGGYGGVHYALQGMDQSGVYDHGAHHAVYNGNMSINSLAGSSFAQFRSNGEREDPSGRTNAASPLVPVVRNTIGNGNFTAEAGVLNGSFTQSDYSEFELDDLLDATDPINFTSLLSCGDNLFQAPQYGTPACSRPLFNLNSPPRREEAESICEISFQYVPPTPNLCRTGQENGFLEKITTISGHENTEEKSEKSMQSIGSSVVNSAEVSKQKEGRQEDDPWVDLNKTPHQKLSKRRKKFMPKVVVEGKPTRKPRKPASQENVKGKETGSGKRKKAQNTNLKESATKKPAVTGNMSNTSPEVTLKSCRKALSFDLEKNGDARQGDPESEIVQNTSGSSSLSEIRDAAGGSCVDSVTKTNQTNGLVATNQPLEENLLRASQPNHPHIPVRDQQPELSIGNQQSQFPVVSQIDIHQAWLQMTNDLGFPFGNQLPDMAIRNQQTRLAMGNQQPMYLTGIPRPALASGNQQSGSLKGNKGPMFFNQQTQPTYLPAVNEQYRSLAGMQQLVMSTGGQQHGLLMRNQQPGSSLRGQQPFVPLMNQEPVTRKGFTHLNPMVAASMSSPGLRPHSQSQTPATNLQMESVSRSLNGTAVMAKLDEARGSKRQYDRVMQNHDLNPVLQQIAQSHDVERQKSSAEHLDAAKKMKIQKVVQNSADNEKSVVLKTPAKRGRPAKIKKSVTSLAQASDLQPTLTKTPSSRSKATDNGKSVVLKTPAKRGRPAKIKKSVTSPAQASDLQPTLTKTPSSRSKATEKGRKSKQDPGKARGSPGELLCQDSIEELIYRLHNLILGEQEQNALVLYREDGAIVPYEEKKQKPRPKVDLDDETTRIWNLLMGKGKDDEDTDKKKEKWWEEERRIFRGRADSFIARMHLVQGDRRFSPWKGSVVDSVIGVFLTQNVSDHLSSSAFMSLAARFPPKLSSNREEKRNIRSVVVEDPEGCSLNLNDSSPCQEKGQHPSNTQVSGVDSGSKEQQQDCSNSGVERFSFFGNSSQNVEDYFDPAVFQSCRVVGSCSGSGDAQTPETANLAQKRNWKDSLSFGQPSSDTNWPREGPTNVSSSCKQSTIRQPQVLDIEDFGMQGEGLGYSCLSVSPRVSKGKNNKVPRRVVRQGGNSARKFTGQIIPPTPQELPRMGLSTSSSTHQKHCGDCQHNHQCGSRSLEKHTEIEYKETNSTVIREMKGKLADGKKPTSQWDSLRQDVERNGGRKERTEDNMDSIDYEAIRSASITEISDAIKERGMNNMLAVRIKDFLDRIVEDHSAIDLEWLKDVPPDKAKDYLLSIRGLGLKSVECVRLLTLHQVAFPVDTNVGRIAVRLGWVPLQTLPESLQLHLLELYPVLESIQKYLWPRLCKLDQRTLYELHYQLITFGKVFCTKSRPNCNACPMRGECRHFASAYASARLALPAPDERSLTTATVPAPPAAIPMMHLPPPLDKALTRETPSNGRNCEPVIEEPTSPEQEWTEITESDIEDDYYDEDPDDIPSIELNIKQFGMTLREYMEKNMDLQEGDMSKALVALNPATTSIPTQKLKNISRLRTEHQVYELPDSHPLLHGMEKRDRDDQSPYLLAIWTPGEMANSSAQQEWNSQTIKGTLLIPVRSAMRGRFPLNGTYFQVNEFFAHHESSLNPIDVPRDWIWNLPRRTVYFGTSVTSICRGLSTEQIQDSFWNCFVCVRGFEEKTRVPRPLVERLHFTASRSKTTNKGQDKKTK
ncbi:unnamed protein product [Microthlaspi erraticum]|uniref:HhH-GPD domain-containing protein n=1 Tax=Microthlaspi erraticum TaxID=1685480 RepID=A0A6D2IXH9_9BRAS|nr:unnamed protein product [Microthlaspi erraticum]